LEAGRIFLLAPIETVGSVCPVRSCFSQARSRRQRLEYSADDPQERIGVSFGTALGGVSNAEMQHKAFVSDGPRSVNHMLALQANRKDGRPVSGLFVALLTKIPKPLARSYFT
jgi:hypothetical protein